MTRALTADPVPLRLTEEEWKLANDIPVDPWSFPDPELQGEAALRKRIAELEGVRAEHEQRIQDLELQHVHFYQALASRMGRTKAIKASEKILLLSVENTRLANLGELPTLRIETQDFKRLLHKPS